MKDALAETGGAVFQLKFDKFRGKQHEGTRTQEVRLVDDPAGAGVTWQTESSVTPDMRALLAVLGDGTCSTQRAVAVKLGWLPMRVSRTKADLLSRKLLTAAEFDGFLEAGRQAEDEPGGQDF